jgi:hypothetical protein
VLAELNQPSSEREENEGDKNENNIHVLNL